ncbi:MAG: PIN domain-containing protein [Actinobacteria bacterium]|nr:PIN domain-containing protein [Actinomycetota bacterium]
MIEQEVFVDTGAWLALMITDDTHHIRAKKIYSVLFKNYQKAITTNLVLAETYIALRRTAGHQTAISFLGKMQASPRVEKIYSTNEIEEKAFDILKKYVDQDFSFTDAVSFCLMKQRKIKKAFAFDNHFIVAGFSLVSEKSK